MLHFCHNERYLGSGLGVDPDIFLFPFSFFFPLSFSTTSKYEVHTQVPTYLPPL